VEERLLFDRIALHAAHVSPGNVKSAALVVSDFTDSELAICDRATMPAGIAAHSISVELLIELALPHVVMDNVSKGGHGIPLGLF
jgi:hypothetical protein